MPKSAVTRVKDFLLGILLFASVLIAYWPALRGQMVLDDDTSITPAHLTSWQGLGNYWFNWGTSLQYYPLTYTAFWLEHRLWGDAVTGYHVINLLEHALSALLVVAIVRRLSLPGGWLAAFVFALHPVCVESVAYMSEQKNTLSTLFYLLSMLVYLRFDKERRPLQYFVATVLFVLALLAKTVAVTLVPALLVLFWWQRRNMGWKRDVLPLLPWFAVGMAAGLVTSWYERHYCGAVGINFLLSPVEKCLLASRAICFYFAKLLWPSELVFFYPRWTVSPAIASQYLFPLVVITVGLVLLRVARHHRGPLAAFLFFCATLFPALGFFGIHYFVFSYVADHFQYVASLGVIVPLAVGATSLARRMPAGFPWLAPVLCGSLLVVFAVLTWRQSHIYRDPITLYRSVLAHNPGSGESRNNLASALADQGKFDEAIAQMKLALQMKPDAFEWHANLAGIFDEAGRSSEAIAEGEAAVRINPNFAMAHYNLGRALFKSGARASDAIAHLEDAVRLKPDLYEAHNMLGIALSRVPSRLPDAVAHFKSAVQLQPDSPVAAKNLAIAERALQRAEAAGDSGRPSP